MHWHVPSQEEVTFAKELFFSIYDPILAHYRKNHFACLPEYNYANDFSSIIDTALTATDSQSRSVKIEH